MKIPRIVIAGTNSGCGKTTISTGIMAALVKRGLKVQPFKVGPDYIDPMFHTFITGRYSRNLDSWILKEEIVKGLFVKNTAMADLAVVEGVMGMYDGYGGYSIEGSTAHVSRLINAPVILVINGEGLSLSAAAIIKGFADFDRNVDIKGVIINNLKSEYHYKLLKEVIEENTGICVIGYLTRSEEYSFQSRHLGLIPSGEVEGLRQKIDLLASNIERTVDLDKILNIATGSGDMPDASEELFDGLKKIGTDLSEVYGKGQPIIAVAMDNAFNFYYRDNLELLQILGARLVFFSPVKDKGLPEDIDGLYIGGGYPEVYAKDLQDNLSMREDIRERIMQGLPTYAECGGFMYLSERIFDKDDISSHMVGIIPGSSKMTTSLKRFGYIELESLVDNVISKKGYKIRGHEFHYSVTEVGSDIETCFNITKSRKGKEGSAWKCGYKINNLLAGYPHLHFWSNPDFATEFITNCYKYKNQRLEKRL